MGVQTPVETVCDEQEAVARCSVIRRLDGYRLRITSPLDEATRDQVHQAIAEELSKAHSGLSACAAAILNSRICPPTGCDAWKTLVEVRDSGSHHASSSKVAVVESSTCLRLIAQVTAHWGAKVVEHYGWISRGRSFLERLWAVADLYPAWDLAARRLNAVLLFRHELVLMGKATGAARSWQTVGNEAEKGNPRLSFSPVTSSDLKNALDWTETGQLVFSDFSLGGLDEGEARVWHWASSTAETITFLDGSRLSDRPSSVQSSAMLARDMFGLLVREDTLRRRPRRSPGDLSPPAKRRRFLRNSSQPSDDDDAFDGRTSAEMESVPSPIEGDDDTLEPSQSNGRTFSVSELGSQPDTEERDPSPVSSAGTDLSEDPDDVSKSHDEQPVSDEWAQFMGGKHLFAESHDIQRLTPNKDPNESDRSEISSIGTPASWDEDDISELASSQTSADNDEDTLGLRSPDCPLCKGECKVGAVPRETALAREDAICSPRRNQQFVDMHGIADLVQERQATDTKGSVQRSWAADLQMASVYYDPDPANQSTASRKDADLWCLDSDRFKEYTESGIQLDRPILVPNAVRDAGWYSIAGCISTLRRKIDGQSLQVRDQLANEIIDLDGDEFLDSLVEPHSAFNALDLPAFIRGDKPEFTLLPRYRLLDDLLQKESWDPTTNQTSSSELHLMGHTQFNMASGRGAFSGAHLDSMNGTWIRNFVGRSAWMFIPPSLLTAEDLASLARDGDNWRPRDKARTIVLRPDDVFFMPPGQNIIHAVLTLEASIMEGAMIWDEHSITSILNNMHWIANNQNATNESWPNNAQAVLARLDQAVFADPERFWSKGEIEEQLELYKEASAALRALPCTCVTRCTKSCSCRLAGRRCTFECEQHEARKLVCMKDV